MKRTLKKIVALVTVLSMLLLTVPTFAHSGSVGVTDIQKTMKGYSSPSKSPYQILYMGATMSTKKITITYTNKKIGTVKKQKVTNPLGETRVIFTFVPKQAGTTTTSIKIGSKTYKTKITILKYKNPIVSITINGKKISGRKFNKTDVIKLNYNTYKGKKNKITYQIKNGWYRVSTLRVGVLACGFLFAIRNCYIRKESHGFTNTITRVENLNAG